MKQIWMVLFALIFVSCKEHEPKPDTKLRRVVVVYMAAENSLSDYSDADLSEIRLGLKYIPDSCQLVVYLDKASYQMPQLLLFDKKQGEQVMHEFRNDPVSTDSAAMQQVLAIVKQRCPARNYGLVLWSHASGWIPQQGNHVKRKTFGMDNGGNTKMNTGQEMEISTLANVLKKSGIMWDYVFFDACFMQCVEVAYELRNVTQWCIGSPAEIPGKGAPYAEIMADLFREPDDAWHIIEDYYEHYIHGTGVVLSAIRTSELEALAEATAPLLAPLPEYPVTNGIQRYNPANMEWKPAYYDLGSAMHKWCTEADYQTWRVALERAVPYRYATDYWLSIMPGRSVYPEITDPEHIAAMSVYIPVEKHKMNDWFQSTSWWRKLKRS